MNRTRPTRLLASTWIASALLGVATAAAQSPTAAAPPALMAFPATMLSVVAEGQVDRAPDIADLSAGVVTSAPTAAQAMQDNATRMTAVITALRKLGIAERDIQTSGISLQPQYVYRENQPPRLTGYQAINNVQTQVRKLAEIGRIIDMLVAQGANQISGPTFRIDQPDPALDEARLEALAKARQRADLYARAVGMKVKRIVQISEGAAGPPPYPMPMIQVTAARAEKSDTPVAPGEVRLTTQLTVAFELE